MFFSWLNVGIYAVLMFLGAFTALTLLVRLGGWVRRLLWLPRWVGVAVLIVVGFTTFSWTTHMVARTINATVAYWDFIESMKRVSP
jgi:hypothetical protein